MIQSPSTFCERQLEDACHNETREFTLGFDSTVITVTCNRPSVTALTNFTNTMHEILLNLLNDNQENQD